MGYMSALGMAESVLTYGGLRAALSWHFSVNCYPPIPPIMLDVSGLALYHVVFGDYEIELDLPDGVLYRGKPTASAIAIVDGHRLDAFVDALVDARDKGDLIASQLLEAGV